MNIFEIRTNNIGALHKAFADAVEGIGEGQHARLTLEKDGEFFSLYVANNQTACPGCEVCGPGFTSSSVTDGLSGDAPASPVSM